MKLSIVRFAAVAAVIATGALALAGCSSTNSTTSGSTTSTAGGTGAQVTEATIGLPSKLLSLDMDTSLDEFGQIVMKFVGGRLYELVDGKPVPTLAKSASASADGLTWTFTLVPDAKFSDGSALTSADVKASFERSISDTKQVNPSLFAHFASVQAPSADTVLLKLKQPYPDLPIILSYAQFSILPAKDLTQAGFFDKPISAGAYVIDSVSSDAAKLTANPTYVGPAPTVKTLDFTVVPDANSALAQVRSKQLDVAWGLPANLINVIPKDELAVAPRYGLDTVLVQPTNGPLSQLGVRQAISMAIDRQQISTLAWSGKMPALAGAWPQDLPGYDSSISTAVDLTAAKKALAGTSCANGCTINLTYSTDLAAQQEQEATVIQQNLAKIGITVKADQVDATAWNDAYSNGTFALMLCAVFDFGPVTDNVVQYPLPLGSKAYDSYPGMDQALATASEKTGAERDSALKQISELIRQNVPWIPLTETGVVAASTVSSKEIGFTDGGVPSILRADGSMR